MATVLKARVAKATKINADTVYLNCEMVEPLALGFKGGQYIIINSGRLLPNGKLGKRAYSILSSDKEQERFELVVKEIPSGVGSGFVHELKENDVFEFSGPWGKYQIPENSSAERILCIATDTGITAALGLLKGKAAEPWLDGSKLVWFVSASDYFLPPQEVRSRLPQAVSAEIISSTPEIKDPQRLTFVEEKISGTVSKGMWTKIYLSGDGLIIRHLKVRFLEVGYQPEQIFTESFFHHESLKTATV